MQTAEWPSQILDVREIGDYNYQVPLMDPDPSQWVTIPASDGAGSSVGFDHGICIDFILDDPPLEE